MDDYHFFADLLSTWRSTNDDVKIITIIGFYVALIVLVNSVLIIIYGSKDRYQWKRFKARNQHLFPPKPNWRERWQKWRKADRGNK